MNLTDRQYITDFFASCDIILPEPEVHCLHTDDVVDKYVLPDSDGIHFTMHISRRYSSRGTYDMIQSRFIELYNNRNTRHTWNKNLFKSLRNINDAYVRLCQINNYVPRVDVKLSGETIDIICWGGAINAANSRKVLFRFIIKQEYFRPGSIIEWIDYAKISMYTSFVEPKNKSDYEQKPYNLLEKGTTRDMGFLLTIADRISRKVCRCEENYLKNRRLFTGILLNVECYRETQTTTHQINWLTQTFYTISWVHKRKSCKRYDVQHKFSFANVSDDYVINQVASIKERYPETIDMSKDTVGLRTKAASRQPKQYDKVEEEKEEEINDFTLKYETIPSVKQTNDTMVSTTTVKVENVVIPSLNLVIDLDDLEEYES